MYILTNIHMSRYARPTFSSLLHFLHSSTLHWGLVLLALWAQSFFGLLAYSSSSLNPSSSFSLSCWRLPHSLYLRHSQSVASWCGVCYGYGNGTSIGVIFQVELSARFPLSFPFSCGCQFINVDISDIHVDVVAAAVVPVDFISMALL